MGKTRKLPVHSSLFRKLLRRRVQETYGSSSPPINDLIDGLRTKYPEYCRQKPQLFTRMVKQILDSDNNKNGKRKLSSNDEGRRSFNSHGEDDDDIMSTSSRSTASKKAKKNDTRERRLRTSETRHVACRRVEVHSESSELRSFSEDGGEDIGAVATSEDEVYIVQSEPEIDLTKSMLRSKYSEKPINVELGLVTDREKKTAKPAREQKSNNLCNGPRFKDIGGMDDLLEDLTEDVLAPLYHLDVALSLGVCPVGILLNGPPGCGKTTLAHAIANESGVPFYRIAATELISGISGASEENIRELFSKAHKTSPSIVFIDEIDAIASKRENLQRETDRHIVTQLMTCMEATSTNSDGKPGYVLVIAATNRPDAIDPALRRPGRFDIEITLGVPDEDARTDILSVLTQSLKLEGAVDLAKVSRLTPGFVGTDLAELVKKAMALAWKRKLKPCKDTKRWWKKNTEQNKPWWKEGWAPEEGANITITMSDFEEAAKLVQPSTKREGFSSIPNVKWEDVGGLDLLRKKFHCYIGRRIKCPNAYTKRGLDFKIGFLLYGPPGCGKTLIAKALANEAGANFIHIKLLNKYVGESELAVRTIFSRARTCPPCILFFDEIDALTKKEEGGWVADRVLKQLLIELDGGDQRKGVYVIGATNRPEVMDPAILRPGRFGKIMYVPLPNQDERGLILKALSRTKQVDADVDLIAIARSDDCANFSGADLSELMHEAAMIAHEEELSKIEAAADEGVSYLDDVQDTIKALHFKEALEKISPSVSNEEKQHYDLMSKRFSRRKSS